MVRAKINPVKENINLKVSGIASLVVKFLYFVPSVKE